MTYLRSRLHIWKAQLNKMIDHIEELSEYDVKCPARDQPNRTTADDPAEDEIPKGNSGLLHRTDCLTRDRLRDMVEEFNELIEDCSMRVDGMAMATQWVSQAPRLGYLLRRSMIWLPLCKF